MRFEVPQFIDIEDKIFGPLTWRQFLYLGGGIGLGVVLFFVNKLIFLFFGLPLIALAGALSFYPVNNRPFSFFLEAVFNYLGSNKLYLWQKKEEIIHKGMFTPNSITNKTPIINETEKKKAIEAGAVSLAKRLELEALQKKE